MAGSMFEGVRVTLERFADGMGGKCLNVAVCLWLTFADRAV